MLFRSADTSSLKNPNKIYTGLNTYSIKLVLTSDFGCKDSVTKMVTVNPKPNVGFTINNLSQCLNGNNFLLSDTSNLVTGILSRIWNLGEGTSDTSTSMNAGKSYAASGTYAIKLISNNNGCKDSITSIVNVYPKPKVGFTINNSSQCLNGNNFLFIDTSTISNGTLKRKWDFGTGTSDTSSSLNPIKIYINPSTFSVKLVSISNNNCKDSTTKAVIINPKPNVGFSINNIAQCLSGNNFLFSDTSKINSGTLTRKWNFGTGISDTSLLLVASKKYSNASTNQIKLISTSNFNCKDSLIKIVTVYAQPKAGFTQNSLTQCLTGNNFHFDDTTTGTSTRLWDLGDQTTNPNDTFSKTYSTFGSYGVMLKITDAHNCSDSITKMITVKTNPAKPSITALSKSLLQSSTGNSYQWYFNNNVIASATHQTLVISQNGNYNVQIDSTNGCLSISDPFIAAAAGVEQNMNSSEIKIYPNPATNEIFINCSSLGNLLDLKIEIFDLKGAKLEDLKQEANADHIIRINLRSLDAGIYFVKVHNEAFRFVKIE